MKIVKRIVVATVSVAVATGACAALDLGSASAAPRSHKTADATGTETCSSLTGTFSFKPALTSNGTAPSTGTISVKLGGCGGGTPAATSGALTYKTTYTTSSCTALVQPNPTRTESVTVKWSPKTIAPSTTLFGDPTVTAGSNLTVSLSNGATVGSYKSSSSSATLTIDSSKTALLAQCAAKKGLSKLVIASGMAST